MGNTIISAIMLSVRGETADKRKFPRHWCTTGITELVHLDGTMKLVKTQTLEPKDWIQHPTQEFISHLTILDLNPQVARCL